MSDTLKYVAPDELKPETTTWLNKRGFIFRDSGTWSKPTSYFIRANNPKPEVTLVGFVLDGTVTFDMELQGVGQNFNQTVAASEIPESMLVRNGTGIENKLCDAWNDLNS